MILNLNKLCRSCSIYYIINVSFIYLFILLLFQVLVYVMDKIVWMLLITALTTQALQIAGVISAPKGLQEITYTQVKIASKSKSIPLLILIH